MSTEFFYMADGKPTGPFSAAKLRQMIEAKKLPPSVPIWAEGMAGWLPAKSVAEMQPPAPKRIIEAPASLREVEPPARIQVNTGSPPGGPARQPINQPLPPSSAVIELLDEVEELEEAAEVSPPPVSTRQPIGGSGPV